MTISLIEESEIPENYVVGSMTVIRSTADGVGTKTIFASGHHPKLRLVSVRYFATAYSTTADAMAIEDAAGTDYATLAQGSAPTAAGTDAAFTISDPVVERNEVVNYNLVTDGNAANAGLIIVQFESIH